MRVARENETKRRPRCCQTNGASRAKLFTLPILRGHLGPGLDTESGFWSRRDSFGVDLNERLVNIYLKIRYSESVLAVRDALAVQLSIAVIVRLSEIDRILWQTTMDSEYRNHHDPRPQKGGG